MRFQREMLSDMNSENAARQTHVCRHVGATVDLPRYMEIDNPRRPGKLPLFWLGQRGKVVMYVDTRGDRWEFHCDSDGHVSAN